MGITRSHLGDYEGSMNNVHKLTLNHELPQLTDLRILKVSRSGVQAEGSGPGPPSPCLWTKDINGRSGWVSGLAPQLPPYRPSHIESWEAGQPQPKAMSGSSGDTPPLHRRQTEGMPGAETRSQSGQPGPLMGWRQEAWRGGCTSPGPKDMFQLWIRRQAAGGPGLSTYPLWLLDDSDLKSDLPASLGLYDNIFTIAKTPRVVGAPWFYSPPREMNAVN